MKNSTQRKCLTERQRGEGGRRGRNERGRERRGRGGKERREEGKTGRRNGKEGGKKRGKMTGRQYGKKKEVPKKVRGRGGRRGRERLKKCGDNYRTENNATTKADSRWLWPHVTEDLGSTETRNKRDVLVTYLVSVTKYLTKSNLRMERLAFGSQFNGIQFIQVRIALQQESETSGHIISTDRKLRTRSGMRL